MRRVLSAQVGTSSKIARASEGAQSKEDQLGLLRKKKCFRCLGDGHFSASCTANVKYGKDGCTSVQHHELLHKPRPPTNACMTVEPFNG